VAIALPFNLGPANAFLLETFPAGPLALWTFLPAVLGPAIGALIARRVDRRTDKCMTLLGEELGWRGYLADALQGLPAWTRYRMTALLWWPWHLRFETTFDWLGFPLIVLASSVVLGHADTQRPDSL
jgi:hypothetical protein